ncbi:MAG: hypothetical protein IKQ01_03300 [Bacteroidales bacterium]|nr:hypothetical protein [Bacteroidales bacterium]
MKYFFHLFSLLLLLAAASACGVVRPVIQPDDSTRVEVRYETVTLHDTAYVELPVIIEKIQTLDTTSTPENNYAKSEATVTAGILSHSLETKPAQLPVPVEKEIVYRDSIVFRDRVVTDVKEVERQLTFWQQFKMRAGVAAMILTVLYGLYLLLRLYLKKK